MNTAAKSNPPSRKSKDELRAENEQLAESARLLGEENQRMLNELAEVRKQQTRMAPNSTTAIAAHPTIDYKYVPPDEQGEFDPVTGNRLVPALTPEEVAAQDEAIARQYDSQMDVDDAVAQTPVMPVETNRLSAMAKHNLHTIRPSMETDERETGHHGKVQQFLDTPAGEDPKLTTFAREVDVLAAKNKAANIAFMKQLVTIHIHMTTDRQADKIFSIGVNGRQWSFERNKEYTVPRYVVEGLLRAKPMTYGNDEITKSNGERTVVHPIQQGCRYPFAIVHDTYPKWREWMAFTMQQPD